MSMKAVVFTAVMTLFCAASFGQTASRATTTVRSDYQAQLQTLATDVQSQIQALEAQIAAAAQPQDKDNLQRQIAQTKREGEIHRLEILLDWAHATGDQAKASEVEQVLNNWRNPQQPTNLPQLPKNEERATNANKPEASTPVTNPSGR